MSRGSSMRFSARPMYGVLVVSATGHLRVYVVCGLSRTFSRSLRDRVENVRVARAAAQVSAQPFGDFVARRLRVLREQMDRRHDHAWRAEAALQAVAVPESLLHRMQMAVRDAFDRRDRRAVGLHGEHRARLDGLAVDEHRARAADAGLAADVRPGEAELIAKGVDEQRAQRD